MNITCEHLFVYGTLRRASPHPMARELARAAHFVGEGKMRGRLHSLGAYPGMTPATDAEDWVPGDVYRLQDPAAMFPILDQYEGAEFVRMLDTVLLDSGTELPCWVYVYHAGS